jgi:Cu(I)/Ag(I) efflux system membrane fusion protein
MLNIKLFVLIIVIVFCSCGNKTDNTTSQKENKNNNTTTQTSISTDTIKSLNEKDDDTNETTNTKTQPKQITDEFKSGLTAVFKSYLALSSALVTSSTEDTKSAAGNIKVSLKKVSSDGLDEDSKNKWNGYLSKLNSYSNQISKSEDIETQRKTFYELSGTLAKAIKRFGIKEKSVYKIFCPMAFDGKGAFWLNDAKEVINPYFGDQMLHCGEVQEQLSNGG